MIPVCEPFLNGNEKKYINDCVESGWISSKGKYVNMFEREFSKYCGSKYGITTSNGTVALHLALAALGIQKGDEVIIPSFTMISTAFAVAYTGAKLVLVDADPVTWNIDVSKIEDKITDKTKVIIPVHIYGHPVDMDPLLKLAKENNIYVVEDAAEAHGAEYKGIKVGALGDIGCFSFYANKIITCGEGGMVVTNNHEIALKAISLKNLCFPSKRRIYIHSDIGYNYRMTNMQAAIGLAQLEKIDDLVHRRREHAYLYNECLKKINGITLPPEEKWAKNVYWMYSILIDEKEFGLSRDQLMSELEKKGIETRPFFVPMHMQPVFRDRGLFIGERYPVAEKISKQGLNLPSGSGLTKEQILFVCNVIKKVRNENI